MALDSPRNKRAKTPRPGRPRVYSRKATRITLACDPTIERYLRDTAALDGITPSQLLAELIARDMMIRERVIAIHVIDRVIYDQLRSSPTSGAITQRAAGGK